MTVFAWLLSYVIPGRLAPDFSTISVAEMIRSSHPSGFRHCSLKKVIEHALGHFRPQKTIGAMPRPTVYFNSDGF